MSEKLYVVCFKTAFGEIIKGQPLSYRDASAWLDEMNQKYPNMNHWIEKV